MARDVCFYDGRCGLCRRSRAILTVLDWFRRLEFIDMSSLESSKLPVDPDVAMRGMPMRTGGGRVLVGYQAVRRALLQTPLGCLPAALLYVPAVSTFGSRVYTLIATQRGRDSCAIELRATSASGVIAGSRSRVDSP
jgi:predicted DCC family thiol-disulfide oxidoreductase YuxK